MSNGVASSQFSGRVIRGGFWVFALRITQQVFNLVRLVILARLLAPVDFGLIGIALLTVAALDTLSETGFREALIQKKENIESYLNSAWTILIFRGFMIFGALYFSAPYVARFFDSPGAQSVIRVIGLSVLFQAFTNIGVVYFQKELEFNKQFLYELSGTLSDFVVSLSLALIFNNVWALVFGLLAGEFVRCFLSYLIHPYRPRPCFEWARAKELWGFGRWVLGSSILIFLITHGDDIFVGKVLGATALGFYQMAYRISNMPATEITHTTIKVIFPAFSKLQCSSLLLQKGFLRVLRLVSFLSLPVAGGILVLSDNLPAVLGEQWKPIIPLVMILSLQAASRSIRGVLGSAVMAVGRPEVVAKNSFLQLVVLVLTIYPASSLFGISGVAMVVALQTLVTTPSLVREVLPKIHVTYLEFIKAVAFPLLASLGVVCIMFLVQLNVGFGVPSLMGEAFLITLIYAGFCLLCWRLGVFSQSFEDLRRLKFLFAKGE
ncbi:MAG TPA: lipopolysaccharide biosynthesis protein [Thermodesulfobacteriota bacterium]|nr:lipopolysaccharide biosynthesis protein [Thermodesulfobacteriota bacterium]